MTAVDKEQLLKAYEEHTGGKDVINLIVIGHVDAGKSTLMGHLLFQLGQVSNKQMHKYKQESQKIGKSSFAYAWVLDETEEERFAHLNKFTPSLSLYKHLRCIQVSRSHNWHCADQIWDGKKDCEPIGRAWT